MYGGSGNYHENGKTRVLWDRFHLAMKNPFEKKNCDGRHRSKVAVDVANFKSRDGGGDKNYS